MRRMKKWLALALALSMAVPNISGLASDNVSTVYAAEETAKTWDEWVNSLKTNAEMAVHLTGDDQKFDGTRAIDVSAEYAEKMQTLETGSMIVRFKVDELNSHSVILGTRNSEKTLPANIDKSSTDANAVLLSSNGKFRFVYTHTQAEKEGPYSFTDGNWHTAVLSGAETGKNIRITIDGVEQASFSNRADLVGMFNKQTGLNTVTIGGHKNGDAVVGGFKGSISDVIVTKETLSDEDAIAISAAGYTVVPQMGSAIATTMLDINLRDNTWLFTGGEAVQGGFDQTRGIRNYIGQFEEYIRWRKIDGSPVNARQRFTFNTGKAGQTIADVVENFEANVADLKTKAIVYMVGAEDYSQGTEKVESFKTSLKSFIDQSLVLKDNGAFVIIQKPFAVNDAAVNANIEAYCEAVDEVVENYKDNEEKYSRLLVVDHYTATKDDADFKANKLTNEKLNAKGHLAISKQFAEKVVKYSGTAYPAGDVVLDRVELEQPDEYLNVQPTATAGTDSLAVEIPAVDGVTAWKYELDLDGTIVSGTASANTFEITGLVSGKSYVLKIQSADGEKQLVTMKGTIAEGNLAIENTQVLDEKQQKIAERMAQEEPMTWLFMGDSITHASGLTFGYDGIAQAFEEFVKEGLGRTDDIVLNTAVANANTNTTIEQLDQRLTNYNPDVVSLMIGTNDCSSRVDISVDQFEENMTTILDTITTNYPDAVVILRSMVPFFNDGNREPYRQAYMDVVKEMAETYDAIYIDQYTSLAEATATYTWLPGKMFTDNLHPEANGHRVMTNMFIKACGLWTEDLPMTNLFYDMGIAKENNATVPTVEADSDQIRVSVSGLEAEAGLSLGDVVLKATSAANGQTYETTVKNGINYIELSNLPGETTYTVEVSAHQTNAAKEVTFATQEVTLSKDAPELGAPEVERNLIFEKSNLEITSGTAVDLTSEAYAEELFGLEEGTIIVRYTSTSDYGVQSLFSISNGTTGNNNKHFHVYIQPSGVLGTEIRNDDAYLVNAENAVNTNGENAIALKADAETGEIKLFANGKLVRTYDAAGNFRFADDITGADTILIGATKRGGSNAYTFGGTIHNIQVYGTALKDETLITATSMETPAVEKLENLPKAGSINVTEEAVTEGQPLAAGTGGSAKFRIPALITLDNGDLLAAADARWTGGSDWGGLDTIASVSSDNGETWNYSFPIWFPDSNEQYPGNKVATTAIDPVIVQGNDGTIYCIADMNPSGITTGDIRPAPELGYVEINGTMRLVLTGTYQQPTSWDWNTYGNPEDYEYYVGDFDEDGFAKVINKSNHTATKWIVDEWYNIYELDVLTNTYKPLTQTMVNDTDVIQQNAFYKDSVLHVYNTGYLWLVTSSDNGRTWENPTILNTQIKRIGEQALLASPGQGMVASNGDIIIPFYDNGGGDENASIIWSSDNGKTWTRSNDVSGMWSSESEMVEINNGVLRLFFRNGQGAVCYADFTKVGDTWVAGEGVNTGIPVCSTCNVSAIRYSKRINGKVAVMVACPGNTGGRADGKIFTFLVNEDNSMELFHTYAVNTGYYAYSCMTEMENGNIGLLWENQSTAIRFDELDVEVVWGMKKVVTVEAGGEAYVEETVTDAVKEITVKPNEKIATVTSELVKEASVITLNDYASKVESSLNSFATSAGNYDVSDTEFTFTANGDYWQISNGSNYIDLSNAGNYLGTATDLAVEQSGEYFRIKLPADNRYAVFFKTNMVFDAYATTDVADAVNKNSNLVFDLTLLEKQETVSGDDVIPGYAKATEIKDGGVYLISHIWSDGSVIVLYPANGQTAQTKLVGETVDVKKNVVTITGITPGETTAVVGDVTYHITVNDKRDNPSYAEDDLPTDQITYSAGSVENRDGSEGPIRLAFDDQISTYWHSEWNPTWSTEDCEEYLWVEMMLEESTMVDAIRYLPRPANSRNGDITGYRVEGTVDGSTWVILTEGTWTSDGQNWKLAEFTPTEVVGLKLVATATTSDTVANKFASAAELRVRAYVEPEEEPTPEVPTSVSDIFADVIENEWYVDEIQYVYDRKIMKGYDTLFKPDEAVSRAMVVQTLYKLEKQPEVKDFTKYDTLTDITRDDWWANSVAWGMNNNIVKGYTNVMKFKPEASVTREELATFLYRYAKMKNPDLKLNRTPDEILGDTQVNSWGKEAFAWAIENEIIKGISQTNSDGSKYYDLSPGTGATRAQLATILQRFCEGMDNNTQ